MDTQDVRPLPRAGGANERGLTSDEVARRVEQGLANTGLERPTRSFREIVRANVFTRFNYLIGALLVVILFVAPIQDALFGLVAIANTLIGIAQELRAKWTLDRLSLIGAPRVRVLRDGTVREVDVADVVRDDVIEIGPGEQLVVDAVTLWADGLELNESLVTGESDPILKRPGDPLLSGSFVSAGRGRARATRVGVDSFAGRLTEEARHFQLARSELRAGIDGVLKVVTWLMAPVVVLLVITQLRTQDLHDALAGSVAGTVAIIPEGLVLLTSLAFAASVIRLGRRNVLVQELPAVEMLARVDVVCFDKTGTLTEGDIGLEEVEVIGDDTGQVAAALAALAANDPEPNATMAAVGVAYPTAPPWRPTAAVPFASSRKWSGVSFDGHGSWVVGAPDVLLLELHDDGRVAARVDAAVREGRRVVLLAQADAPLLGPQLPAGLRAAAVVSLTETLRGDAVDTLAFFGQQDVRAVLISGDHPRTVAAVAQRVGIEDARVVTGRELPTDPETLADVVEDHRVFARVTPEDKRRIVGAMQARGHTVAMTGDGVNDVLALKDADIGIAMGAGAPATRNVAQVVLLDGEFSSLPDLVAEGRRVIANIERVANLFLTKTVYAVLLAVAVGVAQLPFPFLPRHLSLVGALTIGIPAFFLALQPNDRRARSGFLLRAVAFSLPAGVAAAVATFAAFWIAQTVEMVGLEEARTTATVTLLGLGVLVLRLLARPLNGVRRALVYGSVVAFLVVALVPELSDVFALHLPHAVLVLAAIGIIAVAGVVMEVTADALEIRLHRPAFATRLGHAGRRAGAR